MKVRKKHLVIFLCLCPLFLWFGQAITFSKSFSGYCEKVLDGDTLIVRGEKIRLIYIDAPEKDQLSFDGKPIGRSSTQYLKNLIEKKWVEVRYRKRGYYGRILGEVFYLKENLNLKLLQEGHAVLYAKKAPVAYTSAYYLARLTRKAIFGTQGFLHPKIYRKKKGHQK
ncbi:MAG: thermonuclease family protein [Bacteriovoracaceae bacterium]|jgi:endonuclease YncB( thermonuclease family)|nr:hypothetical protein [Halobacteriovoraceae bacterium]MDP7322104.1 thermonuclease family protein [Bacteriovoracaceae bacterium]|tara:strand:- start:400 stop:903 length:504 start_codon:yes stop_codon:yes gene_type:complete